MNRNQATVCLGIRVCEWIMSIYSPPPPKRHALAVSSPNPRSGSSDPADHILVTPEFFPVPMSSPAWNISTSQEATIERLPKHAHGQEKQGIRAESYCDKNTVLLSAWNIYMCTAPIYGLSQYVRFTGSNVVSSQLLIKPSSKALDFMDAGCLMVLLYKKPALSDDIRNAVALAHCDK